jgi:hypothetical protein
MNGAFPIAPWDGEGNYVDCGQITSEPDDLSFSRSGKAIHIEVRHDVWSWLPVSLCRIHNDPQYGFILMLPRWLAAREGVNR